MACLPGPAQGVITFDIGLGLGGQREDGRSRDGSEYDSEEARAARAARLGGKPNSRFLNMGVDTQVTWQKEETLISFDRYHLVLMPKTKDNTQSVHIDLVAHRLTDEAGMTVINRFLSLLTWCEDQLSVAQQRAFERPHPYFPRWHREHCFKQ